jgi:hypothetical protein
MSLETLPLGAVPFHLLFLEAMVRLLIGAQGFFLLNIDLNPLELVMIDSREFISAPKV